MTEQRVETAGYSGWGEVVVDRGLMGQSTEAAGGTIGRRRRALGL